MSRLNSRGSFGELGPGDLEMLLLRLQMRKERGGKDRVVLRDPPENSGAGTSGPPIHSNVCSSGAMMGEEGSHRSDVPFGGLQTSV